jgi:hypothetical protein
MKINFVSEILTTSGSNLTFCLIVANLLFSKHSNKNQESTHTVLDLRVHLCNSGKRLEIDISDLHEN